MRKLPGKFACFAWLLCAATLPAGKTLGQTVIVENRPGAAQVLATELVAKAEPDGCSIGLIDSGPLTISPHFKAVPFDVT